MTVPKRKHLSLWYDQIDSTVFPLVVGRVFHVTRLSNLPNIIREGILSNQDGKFDSPFGSKGYFSSQGCVSFYDFRSDNARDKTEGCPPFHLAGEASFAVFFLAPNFHHLLRDHSGWGVGGVYGKIVGCERGFPNMVPMDGIEEILEVEVFGEDPLVKALNSARRRMIAETECQLVQPSRRR